MKVGDKVTLKGAPLSDVKGRITNINTDEDSVVYSVQLEEERGAYKIGDVVDVYKHEVVIGHLPF